MPFLTYVSGLANCMRSPTGFKEGIALVPGRHCAGCHHATSLDNQNLCGHVTGPSPRAIVNLLRIAQVCALVRSARTQTRRAVGLDDLMAVAPFVLRGKLGLDPQWLASSGPRPGPDALGFAGCEWIAIRSILDYLRGQFEEFIGSDAYWIADDLAAGKSVTVEEREHLLWHIDNGYGGRGDNWCFNRIRLASGCAGPGPRDE